MKQVRIRLNADVVQRSKGGSTVRRAAYQAAEERTDPRTGEVFDYTDKSADLSSLHLLRPRWEVSGYTAAEVPIADTHVWRWSWMPPPGT